VMDAPCPLPSREEQDEIVRIIDEAFERMSSIKLEAECALALIDRLKQATLEIAFYGELSTEMQTRKAQKVAS
jgi:hypothetical protein